MVVEIDGLKIHFKVSGQGRDMVLLHGWGADLSLMNPIHKHFERYFHTISVDLPGFGLSDQPPHKWGVADYAAVVKAFLHSQGLERPILMGHSFGGKVSILLAAQQLPLHKLILVDSSGIVPKRDSKYYFKIYSYKTARRIMQLPGLKQLFRRRLEVLKNRSGSEDYRNARGVMRETLVKVINEDLTGMLAQIKVPTLLMWGANDTATPVSDGRLMEQLIPDAGLVVLENAGHYSYLDRLPDFLHITGQFLKEDMETKDA